MKNVLFFIIPCFVLLACSDKKEDNSSPQELRNKVKFFEDSLKTSKIPNSQLGNQDVAARYANLCIDAAEADLIHPLAAKLLDKAHVIFASVGLHQRSIEIGERVLAKFPQYENRTMIIESMATAYDIFILPRKSEKVKKYYEMLLSEGKNLDEERKKEITNRIENSDKTFVEIMLEQIENQKK